MGQSSKKKNPYLNDQGRKIDTHRPLSGATSPTCRIPLKIKTHGAWITCTSGETSPHKEHCRQAPEGQMPRERQARALLSSRRTSQSQPPRKRSQLLEQLAVLHTGSRMCYTTRQLRGLECTAGHSTRPQAPRLETCCVHSNIQTSQSPR